MKNVGPRQQGEKPDTNKTYELMRRLEAAESLGTGDLCCSLALLNLLSRMRVWIKVHSWAPLRWLDQT